MKDNTLVHKFSVPMRWLALAAAVEIGLVVLAATAVQSEPLTGAQVGTTATVSPIVSYAHQVVGALVRTETAVLPVETADQLR